MFLANAKRAGNHIYFLNEGSVDDSDIIGIKGSNLCEIYGLGLPVPPACTISTYFCRQFQGVIRKEWMDEVRYAVSKLEYKTGKKFGLTEGSDRRPLLLSVRCSAPKEMPDMMQTILNLGMNRPIVDILTAQTNNGRWALQTYIKFLKMFGTEVRGVDPSKFTDVLDAVRTRQSIPLDALFSIDDLNEICEKFRLLAQIPDDPWLQMEAAIESTYKSWHNTKARRTRNILNIECNGVAITVQCMVFGNLDIFSGSGVAITRNPINGKKELYGMYMGNAEQGDDLLKQKRKAVSLEDLHTEHPEVFQKLQEAVDNLEHHFKDALEVEFTVENLQLFVLETRKAKRAPRAAVQIAVDMVKENILTEREALLRINPAQMEYFLFPVVVEEFSKLKDSKVKERVLGMGCCSTGGAVSGQVAFSPEQALEIVCHGNPCILVMRETFSGQEELLKAMCGVIVQKSGTTAHALDTMRSLGKAGIGGTSNMTLASHGNSMTFLTESGEAKEIHVRQVITIDGHTGAIYSDTVPTQSAPKDANFFSVMQWADRYKRMGVLATADTPQDITTANINGADGIGLCCADRFFFQPEQVDLMRRFILADSALERSQILVQMVPQMQQSFKEIFSLTGNCQMSVRLLNASLQDFLPSPKCPTFEKQLNDMATHLDIPLEHCKARIAAILDVNPLLGFRGARLGIVFPEITEMQVKAIIGAAVELKRRNFIALPQIILPCLCNELEVERMTSIISTVSDNVCAKAWTDSSFNQQYLHSKVGCMLETPRSCLQASAFARSKNVCDVMFDTNVLTALTFGMERADSYNFVNAYLAHHLMAHDPFVSLDLGGVGSTMQSAVSRIKKECAPDVKIGVSGEHAEDAHSITFFERLGVDYVSCSPYRIPIAKVAAAQARITADMRSSVEKSAMRMFK